MNRNLFATIVPLMIAPSALASVTITIDRLDPGDGGAQPPAGIVVVDVLVDASSSDCWTCGGMVAFTQNSARFRYATDPNTGAVLLSNPGTANRFVTFFSKPRPRDANSRFS